MARTAALILAWSLAGNFATAFCAGFAPAANSGPFGFGGLIGLLRRGGDGDRAGGHLEFDPVTGSDARSALYAFRHDQIGFIFDGNDHVLQSLMLARHFSRLASEQ